MQADVTSANIVGYKTQEAGGDGFVGMTPIFDSVNTPNSIKLSELKFSPERYDNIQIFDGNGDVLKQISWDKKGGVLCWVLDDFTDPEDPQQSVITDYTFERGNSFWLQFDSAIDFTQSGAVNTDSVTYNVGNGFSCAGNPRPVDLKLSELVFSNKARYDNIQIFDGNGDVLKQISWDKKGGVLCWVLDDFTDPEDPQQTVIEDYTFPSGSAFWIQCEEEGTVTIPAMTLK